MSYKQTIKILKKSISLLVLISFLIYFPFFFAFYLVCGVVDVCRNKPADLATIKRYFTGNGIFTWLLSPFNLFLDFISFKNKGIYQLGDLPQAYQDEISALLHDVNKNKEHLMDEMTTRLAEIERGMLFFKWYGDNLNVPFALPCFHKNYQFIKTIGISTFNQHKATTVHFGPLRITLRLLYNLSPANEGEVYIQVGGKKHYWKENPLFIFDDTLQHQSVNYSDQIRHCMFVDIIRPTKLMTILSLLLTFAKFVTSRSKGIFYKKWVFLK